MKHKPAPKPAETTTRVLQQIPTMADDALATLLGNAERLEQNGTPGQRTLATTLLPVVREELAARLAAKPPPKPKAPPRKRAVKEVAAEAEASED